MSDWRHRCYSVVFESDTKAGRYFDLTLITVIVMSVIVVLADSMQSLHDRHRQLFGVLECFFTIVFTMEYLARLACHPHPGRYARSFFGIVDLVSILPTYVAMLLPEVYALVDVRVLRLLRVFRVLKLAAYVEEYQALSDALMASRRKVLVFLSAVLMMVVILGTVMYVIEGPANGYTNIPTAIYWAVTTMTTVGFGDITPKTDLGRFIASVMMLLGWGTLAVPTGIVTSEIAFHRQRQRHPRQLLRSCPACLSEDHSDQAVYCMHCGAKLPMSSQGG